MSVGRLGVTVRITFTLGCSIKVSIPGNQLMIVWIIPLLLSVLHKSLQKKTLPIAFKQGVSLNVYIRVIALLRTIILSI